MYLTMCKAFIEGLQKHGVHYKYYESLKGIASLPETELAVCFTNAPRTKPIIEKQSFDSNNYLSLDVGRFHTKGITNFENRNKIYGVDTNTDMKDTSLIYCNPLNNDYITHRYIKNNLKSSYLKFSPRWNLSKFKNSYQENKINIAKCCNKKVLFF